jgi:hypothetical protein
MVSLAIDHKIPKCHHENNIIMEFDNMEKIVKCNYL